MRLRKSNLESQLTGEMHMIAPNTTPSMVDDLTRNTICAIIENRLKQWPDELLQEQLLGLPVVTFCIQQATELCLAKVTFNTSPQQYGEELSNTILHMLGQYQAGGDQEKAARILEEGTRIIITAIVNLALHAMAASQEEQQDLAPTVTEALQAIANEAMQAVGGLQATATEALQTMQERV
jgi:hypothetical protein